MESLLSTAARPRSRFFRRLLASLLLAGGAAVADTPDDTAIHRGRGGPAVVFQAGLGDGKAVWEPLLAELAPEREVFAFDRPGRAGIPLGDRPRDPCTIAAEQRARLREAGIAPPYLLVGHSLGGLYQYAFARLYPEEVAGLVLLDPTHPRHWETLQQEAPVGALLIKALRLTAFSTADRQEFDQQTDCLARLETLPPIRRPARILVSKRFQDVEKGSLEGVLERTRPDWLRLTGAERLDVIWDSGHYIQRDSPEEVVAAVHQLAPPAGGPGTIPAAAAAGAEDWRGIAPGRSTRAEVRAILGTPSEILRDGEREIWVYSERISIPFFVSYLPVIGDIADVIELAQHLSGPRERIIQFDPQGVASKLKLRSLQ